MKTCVFITGTNAVGKSALALSIISRYGGVDRITNDVTYLVESDICLAGKYGTGKFGGVDRITNDKGSSCTSRLADIVEEGLKHCDVIICEGSYMQTFGINLTNAIFKAERQLVVNLYAPLDVLYERLCLRSNGKRGNGQRNFNSIAQKQKQSMVTARKWQSIGVKVLQINSAEMSIEDEAELVIETIKEISGQE